MRLLSALLLFVGAAWAQTVQRYEYDPSGNRIAGPVTSLAEGQRTERVQSINGRRVPIEKIEERVIRADGTERVVERVVQRYNPEGEPVGSLRVLIEEKKLGDGASSVRTTVYRGSQVAERTTEHISRSGGSATSETLVERPSVDGTLTTAERLQKVEQKTGESLSSNTTIYRPDANGRLVEAVKETVQQGKATESAHRYEPDAQGRMRLIQSTQRTSVKRPDGSEAVTVDVYAPNTPGLANQNSEPRIQERQLIERRPSSGGLVETMSIQRPSLSDPARLGPPRVVSETVCSGNCK